MSSSRPFLLCDVFSNRLGAGNGLAVVLDGTGLSGEQMQAFAAYINQSETTFVLPVSTPEASYRIRIFTPVSELPFAGHPSVGSAHAVLEAGLAQAVNGQLLQECAAGLLPITVQGEGAERVISVRAPRGKHIATNDAAKALLPAALQGMHLGELPPALINNGPLWWCVQLADEAAVRTLQPAQAAIAALNHATQSVGLAVFAKADAEEYQLVVRAFCPADNIPEDPVTGSANAAIAAYLHQCGALASIGNPNTASQGRELGRDGFVQVRVDEDGEVWIGGKTQTVVSGSLRWG
ncbi:MAG: PhzF family phenazine biosynthesis protein [Arenimonas sp.]|nr:PhzF family phenazine biosynthesis protein [Arenimonas sp.]MBP7981621.1 PhzF family phenazine biosynthesis protein [Arenimonas sp.]